MFEHIPTAFVTTSNMSSLTELYYDKRSCPRLDMKSVCHMRCSDVMIFHAGFDIILSSISDTSVALLHDVEGPHQTVVSFQEDRETLFC